MLDPGNVLMLHPQETQGLTSQVIFFFWCRVVLGRLVGCCLQLLWRLSGCAFVGALGDGVGMLDVRDGSVQGVFNSNMLQQGCGCLHVTTALLQNQVCVGCVRVPDPYDRGACICR